MKAMILAAGRGERLRPITDTCPKPLVKVGGKELLVWHIEKLKQVGITDILINSAYLSEKIVDFIGDGSKFGVKVTQIHELSAKPLCGKWFDVGTIERLNQVNSYIQNLN